ncbi:hypothetical protein [Acinetobacter oleivorans]|uniref:hypothetical protein n=1 Tax=Acinetobacter oleivorans TaxID=1148157 RepID=UPI003F7B85D3
MFPILSTIPGIHATIVGILAAFFSAFLIFAYQKVTEAQKKLEKALKVAESVSTPTSFVLAESSLINDDGDLDWNGACYLIHNASMTFSHLNYVKYGIDLERFSKDIENDEVIKIVDELTPFFYLFFTSYPMNGKSIETTPQSVLKNSNNQLFDYERYKKIQERISHLIWVWHTSQNSLTHLFNVYDQIKEEKLRKEKDAKIASLNTDFERFSASMFEAHRIMISEFEYSYKRQIEHKKLSLLTDFFQRAQTYQTKVMPILDETIIEFESYNNELKVKKLTKIVLAITIYILIVGIIIPLIFLEIVGNIPDSHKNFIISYLEYFLLIASFLPYFLICFYFFKKIENTIFK